MCCSWSLRNGIFSVLFEKLISHRGICFYPDLVCRGFCLRSWFIRGIYSFFYLWDDWCRIIWFAFYVNVHFKILIVKKCFILLTSTRFIITSNIINTIILVLVSFNNNNYCPLIKTRHWHDGPPMAWEIWFQSQVESYQRLKKWYLMPPCLTLSIIR